MIFKVLVGDEHGGVATSSADLIQGLYPSEEFNLLFLHKGSFSRMYDGKERVYFLPSYAPPIIEADSKVERVFNVLRFLIWLVYTTYLMFHFVLTNKIKVIHTTNNHALLVCLLIKSILPKLYLLAHWRCVGLGSAKRYRGLLEKINKVISISESVRNSLPNSLKTKSVVIYDGVGVEAIASQNKVNTGILRKLIQVEKSQLLFGTIGSFTPIKCHELIIDAMAQGRLPQNAKVVLIGSCPNNLSLKYLEHLKKKVSQYYLGERVIFLEDKNLVNPKYYISDLDVFIGATWNGGLGEGFGLIYVEAMAAGVPVLAINVGAASEIITDSIDGYLIKSNSTKELGDRLFDAIGSSKSLRQSAYMKAQSRFDIRYTIQQVREIYEECCKLF